LPSILSMNIDPVIILIFGVALIILGIVFAFAGRKVWHMLMVLIGALMGGLIGLFIGYYYFSTYGGLVGGIVGSYLGSLIFRYVAESAVPVALAILVFLISYIVLNGNLILCGAIAITVLILAFFIVDVLLSLLTSAIGAILTFFGIIFVGGYYSYPPEELIQLSILVSLLLFVSGLILQMIIAHEERAELKARLTKHKQQ